MIKYSLVGAILATCIACSLFLYFRSSEERQIALLIRSDFHGERSFAYRIQAACKNLNWKAHIFEIARFKRLKKHPYDFVINLVPGTYKFRESKYYLAIFDPSHHYFEEDGSLKTCYSQYDGYLLTYPPALDELSFNARTLPHMRWYPTVQAREYREVDPTHLFYVGCIWGDRFEDQKMRNFLNLIDGESYSRIYGNDLIRTLCPTSYGGAIPFDSDTLCEMASDCGVNLVLHSNKHNAHGLPSGRIFEAAAASTVIICDENPFVKKYFGDSILYVNTRESARSIQEQVNQHMSWIQANKKAALEKAKNAHRIYKNCFSLEHQLLRLGAFHEQLAKDRGLKWTEKGISLIRSYIKKMGNYLSMFTWVASAPFTILPNLDCDYSLINSIDFSPQENVFCATYTHNNKICLYQVVDGTVSPCPIQTLHNPTAKLSEPQHAVFSPDGRKIVVANWTNQTFNLYQREKSGLFTEAPIAILSPPSFLQNCKPHGIAFSPCGSYLAVAFGAASYFDRGIALFQVQENRLECVSFLKDKALSGTPKGISFSPDGTHLLVTFCDPNSIGIFPIVNRTIDPIPKQVIQGEITQLSRPEDIKISPNKHYCAVSNSDRDTVTFYSFDPDSNSITASAPFRSLCNPESKLCFPHGIAFSSDGMYLAVSQFGRVQTTEQGDISWDKTLEAKEASVNLYLMNGQEKR